MASKVPGGEAGGPFPAANLPPAGRAEGVGGAEALPPRMARPFAPEPVPAPAPAAGEGVPEGNGAPLTLQDAIQVALISNPDLRCSEERTRLADAILARARSEFYPQFSISEGFGVTNNAVNVFMFQLNEGRFNINSNLNHPDPADDFHTQLLVQQGLYAGGRRTA